MLPLTNLYRQVLTTLPLARKSGPGIEPLPSPVNSGVEEKKEKRKKKETKSSKIKEQLTVTRLLLKTLSAPEIPRRSAGRNNT